MIDETVVENQEFGEFHHYDATISDSKDQSIAKAMEIMLKDIENYKNNRVIVRPNVSLWKGIIPIVLYLVSMCLLLIMSKDVSALFSINVIYIRMVILAIYIVLFLLLIKPLLIWSINMYQRFAPERIRKLCYFEPSCSEYMKMAIEKYGVVRGLKKGCNRLMRCHWPNGGEDYP